MKRFLTITMMIYLAAGSAMFGQTVTPAPATKPSTRPTLKHTPSSANNSAVKEPATPASSRSMSAGAATGQAPEGSRSYAGSNSQGYGGQGSQGALKCTGPERNPCSETMVRDMSAKMAEKSSEHPALAEINTLTLESPNGTLSCRQNDGKPCTAEQVRSLNEHVAAPLRCEVRFENTRSNNTNTAYNRSNSH
jgi:hypothetical protein